MAARPRRGVIAVAAAVLAAWAIGGCGDGKPPRAAATEQVPSATGEREVRPPETAPSADGQCLAAGHDPVPDSCTSGGAWVLRTDGCRWEELNTESTAGVLVDADGNPAARVPLRFWRRDSYRIDSTAEGGEFRLLLEGGEEYDVDAFLGGTRYRVSRGRRVHVGHVRPGAEGLTLRLPEAQVALAEGVLVDADGRPLEGWSVEALETGGDTDGSVASATTGGDGRFRVLSWRRAHVDVRLGRGPDGAQRRITAQARDPATGALRVEAHRAIAGTVVVDGGTPAGARVTLWRDNGVLDRSVIVDTSGAFAFDDTQFGVEYEISADLTGYQPIARRSCWGESLDVRLDMISPSQTIQGRLVGSGGDAVTATWIRFVSQGGRRAVQAMTDFDGTFRTVEAAEVEYEAFILVPGHDGRLVPGPTLGRVRGGQTSLVLRTPR